MVKKRKKKSIIAKTLLDPSHWLGWLITIGVIIGIFHLLGVHGLHTPYYHSLILLGGIVAVDVFKHVVGLQ